MARSGSTLGRARPCTLSSTTSSTAVAVSVLDRVADQLAVVDPADDPGLPLADPGLSSAGFCSAPRHHTEPVSLRIPSRVVPSLDQNRAHTSSRRGGYGLSGYQTWWRSGRDSNSRTG